MFRIICLTLVVFLATGNPAGAGPIVSLSVTRANPLSLLVGESLFVTVEVSGLHAGDSLEFIGVEVLFDGTVFAAANPVAVVESSGGIVPDFFAGNFNSTIGGVGFAGGLYDSVFPDAGVPITLNGAFFSFQLTALAVGSGVIEVNADPLATSATGVVDGQVFDSFFDNVSLVGAGSQVTFSVTPNASVPEPSSTVALLIGMVLVARLRLQKRCPSD